MKKYILLALTGILLFTSCDDFLDRTPKSDLAPENYFRDKKDMTYWNAGIYSAFASALNEKLMYWSEVRSDNCDHTGYVNSVYYMNALTSERGEYNWQDLYSCIGRCNVAIKYYPNIPSILESEYGPYIAQAYAMRALMYFYIIRVWGDAPLTTTVWDGELSSMELPRTSVAEIKSQILSDIENAIKYFSSDGSDKFYLTKAAAYALKTDVHMWFQEYQEAIDASDYFIGNNSFEWVADETAYKKIFTDPAGSKESIFSMWWSYSLTGKAHGWPKTMGASNTNNSWRMSQKVYNELLTRLRRGDAVGNDWGYDARLWCNVDTVKLYYSSSRNPISNASWTDPNWGTNKCVKFSGIDPNRQYDSANKVYKSQDYVYSSTDAEFSFPIYRYADVMLLRAEALNKMERKEEAIDIVLAVRKRVGYNGGIPFTTTKEDLENEILLERQLEFYAEGKRWFDLMRADKLKEVMEPVYQERQVMMGETPTAFDMNRAYGPIYYKEFEANAALRGHQNPPYSE